jgi:3-oxo-5-alpha-steroid 4-dehydrogenase 3
MEILIYTAFRLVAGRNITLWSVVIFVYVNQIIAARISHKWYKETFKEYPRQRTAIIPFLI